MLSHSVVEYTKHMNAQARVCAYQLRQHFFFAVAALLHVIQRDGIERWPYNQAAPVPSVSQPPTA